MAESSKKLSVGFHNLHPNILGLDPVREGRLRLSQWNQKDKLPLAALADEILTYIDARIAAVAPGGTGTLADAHNYYGSVATSGTATVKSQVVSGWKLRGFHLHGTGDAVATLTFTDADGVQTIKAETDNINRTIDFPFPNPIAVVDGSTVSLSVTNGSGASADYYGVIFGEDEV